MCIRAGLKHGHAAILQEDANGRLVYIGPRWPQQVSIESSGVDVTVAGVSQYCQAPGFKSKVVRVYNALHPWRVAAARGRLRPYVLCWPECHESCHARKTAFRHKECKKVGRCKVFGFFMNILVTADNLVQFFIICDALLRAVCVWKNCKKDFGKMPFIFAFKKSWGHVHFVHGRHGKKFLIGQLQFK
jgi:hypothetical protein